MVGKIILMVNVFLCVDYARWMRYRIEEMPVRLHSVVEVKEFVADKN